MAEIATLEGLNAYADSFDDGCDGCLGSSVTNYFPASAIEVDRTGRVPSMPPPAAILQQDKDALQRNRRAICEATTGLNNALSRVQKLDTAFAKAPTPAERNRIDNERKKAAVEAVRQAHVRADAAVLAKQHAQRTALVKAGAPAPAIAKVTVAITKQKKETAQKQTVWRTDNAKVSATAVAVKSAQLTAQNKQILAAAMTNRAKLNAEKRKPPMLQNKKLVANLQRSVNAAATKVNANTRAKAALQKKVAFAPGAQARSRANIAAQQKRKTAGMVAFRAGMIPARSLGGLSAEMPSADAWATFTAEAPKSTTSSTPSSTSWYTKLAGETANVASAVQGKLSTVNSVVNKVSSITGAAKKKVSLFAKKGTAAAKVALPTVQASILPGGFTVGKVALVGAGVLGLGYFLFLRRRS